jgi:hypothetical protein
MEQAIRMGVLIRESAAFGTGKAAIRGIFPISCHPDRSAALDLDEDPTIRVTKSAN